MHIDFGYISVLSAKLGEILGDQRDSKRSGKTPESTERP